MQLIKSLRSFGRWLFNIKDEVKPKVKRGDIFEPTMFMGGKVIVISVDLNWITFREKGCVGVTELRDEEFLSHYRKIS